MVVWLSISCKGLRFEYHLHTKNYWFCGRVVVKALQKTFFSKIFIFASFGNSCFSNFGNILVISVLSECFRTCKNSRKFTKKSRKNTFFRDFHFCEFWKLAFTKITENNGKNDVQLVSSRLDSRKLVPTQNLTQNFG